MTCEISAFVQKKRINIEVHHLSQKDKNINSPIKGTILNLLFMVQCNNILQISNMEKYTILFSQI